MAIILRNNTDYTPLFDVTAEADKTKGEVELVNDVYGFWMASVESGEDGAFVIKAEQARADKAVGTGDAITAGSKVYYNTTNKTVSNTDTDIFVGWANEDAAAATTTVGINFDGRLHDVIS